jgi:hypothetical protein
MPLVSVVLPTYNQAPFLAQSVGSVLTQTVADLELIIVNDGSTDETRVMIDRIDDPRVRIIHQPNQGASAALNKGFAQSHGRYLTWLASDNLYKPQFLARVLDRISAADRPDLVYTCFENMDEQGRFLDYFFSEPYFPGLLLENPAAVGMAFLYTRELYEAVGAYQDLVCNDLDYWLRAARLFRFVFIPEVLAQNRKHPGMQTVCRRELLLSQIEDLLSAERKNHSSLDVGLASCLQELSRRILRTIRAARARGLEPNQWVRVAGRDPVWSRTVALILSHYGFQAQAVYPEKLDETDSDWVLPLDAETENRLGRRHRVLPLKAKALNI